MNETSDIQIIGFSGGPGSGKTTAVHTIANYLTDKGYTTYIVPEAATILLKTGLQPGSFFFQCCIFATILVLETSVYLQAKRDKGKKIILCDRTLLDGGGYMEESDFWVLARLFGYNKKTICSRYTGIVYMETSAKNAAASFGKDTNDKRYEDLLGAIKTCQKTENICKNHKKIFVLRNQSLGFADKLFKANQLACKQIKIQIPTTPFFQTFALKQLGPEDFQEGVSHPVEIITYILPLSNGYRIPRRLRKKISPTRDVSYFYTKEKNFDGESVQIEEEISEIEFLQKIEGYERNITKRRYYYNENNYMYEIDIFNESFAYQNNIYNSLVKKIPLEGSTKKERDLDIPYFFTRCGLDQPTLIKDGIKDYEINR